MIRETVNFPTKQKLKLNRNLTAETQDTIQHLQSNFASHVTAECRERNEKPQFIFADLSFKPFAIFALVRLSVCVYSTVCTRRCTDIELLLVRS